MRDATESLIEARPSEDCKRSDGRCPHPTMCDEYGCAQVYQGARVQILSHVVQERDRQDAKWGGLPGVERRDDHTYAAVLGEEYGEVCKAWLERNMVSLREELVQVAAVAVAWIEELDNGGAVPRG